MREINVLFINGWGGDMTSQSLAGLRNRVLARFQRTIYAPPPVNHTETGLILRYLEKWKEDQILVGLSCGCSTINLIAKHAPKGERIPYAMLCSPSIWCGLGTTPDIVQRATHVSSWPADFFNPMSRRIVKRDDGSFRGIDFVQTSAAHGFTPGAAVVTERLIAEIERVQKGA